MTHAGCARYFEIYQSASVLTRAAGAFGVAAGVATGGGALDVTAVGHVAGVDAGGGFAVLAVAVEPDVDAVSIYQSASDDAARLAAALAACFDAGGVAAVVVAAPGCGVAVPACMAAPAPADPAPPRCARASNGPSWKINVCAGRVKTAYGNCSSHDISTRPDDVSVKIAGTCFMSLNCT